MNAHPAMLTWPHAKDDAAPLALWDAAAIAAATGGKASGDFLCSGVEIKDIAARSGLNINVKDSDNNNGMSEIHIKTESMRGTEDAVLLWPKTGS